MDDFWSFEPKSSAHSGKISFEIVNEMLGFKLKALKASGPDESLVLLGVALLFVGEELDLSVTPERASQLRQKLAGFLSRGSMSPTEAAKLAGQLNFVSAAAFGSCGRGFLQPIFQLASLAGASVPRTPKHWQSKWIASSDRLTQALQWWDTLLTRFPSRKISPLAPGRLVDIYTDAAGEREAIGGLLFIESSRPLCFGEPLSTDLEPWLPDKQQQKQRITQLEALAVLVAVLRFGDKLQGRSVRFWVDNEDAKWALISGYSHNSFLSRIVAEVWILLAGLQVTAWFERVASADNPADSVSRLDFKLAALQGWQKLSAVTTMRTTGKRLMLEPSLLRGAAARVFRLVT